MFQRVSSPRHIKNRATASSLNAGLRSRRLAELPSNLRKEDWQELHEQVCAPGPAAPTQEPVEARANHLADSGIQAPHRIPLPVEPGNSCGGGYQLPAILGLFIV